eukprot:CAMPEP_0174351090 /NCGR_PEP_ID=MMETSP0811_2-20130205/8324_1 /TAXON_ID=73025 ORGANISM="Eutreptiella gymnastica-like, Strain CCMP1594" /NCGR_SAMPLE_ID=MMETSP0811_2 /ASSEMBLY_ACC=CAM_ASM_000667 /LENGTH=68 /DNA_ID=CAMNT_0015479967 /DNA_START=442 /DNA_END=648 /DNA_ORIENTATION=+
MALIDTKMSLIAPKLLQFRHAKDVALSDSTLDPTSKNEMAQQLHSTCTDVSNVEKRIELIYMREPSLH